jgi:hypothetical protein
MTTMFRTIASNTGYQQYFSHSVRPHWDWSANVTWLLLIYTVPSHPTRKRAAIWRELKKAGAIYLRDGVAVLPERAETHAIFQAIATAIATFGGQSTLVEGARLDPARTAEVMTQAQAIRAAEYADIGRETDRFLAHIAREREHRELSFVEQQQLAQDLGKLRRWAEQVRGRDYFGSPEATTVEDLLSRCEQSLPKALAETHHQRAGRAT